MMIGLEVILKEKGIQNAELAKTLGINRQNINNWTSGRRNIPSKYVPDLIKMFEVPSEYFQKEVNEQDKFIIKNYLLRKKMKEKIQKENEKLHTQSEFVELEKYITDEDGKRVKIYDNFYINDYEDTIKLNNAGIKKLEVMNKVDTTFEIDESHDVYDAIQKIEETCSLYEMFIKALEHVDYKKIDLLLRGCLMSKGITVGFGDEEEIEEALTKTLEQYKININK